jgi:hypothetical protein
MPTLRVDRVVTAGPTGTALLLARPAALDAWPGATRLGSTRRLPTAYVTDFAFAGGEGSVRLSYEPAAAGPAWTCAALTVTFDAPERGAEHDRAVAALRALADGFLADLAAAAEERADAA